MFTVNKRLRQFAKGLEELEHPYWLLLSVSHPESGQTDPADPPESRRNNNEALFEMGFPQ